MRLTQTVAGTMFAALCLTIPSTPAQAVTPTGHGTLCSLDSSDGLNEGVQSGIVGGGPFVAYDADNPTFRPDPYVVCTIQVGGNGVFSEPDAAMAIFWEVGWVGYVPPTRLSYPAPVGAPVYMCSEIWIATSDGHFSIYYDDVESRFELDPATANCQLATPNLFGALSQSQHITPRVVV